MSKSYSPVIGGYEYDTGIDSGKYDGPKFGIITNSSGLCGAEVTKMIVNENKCTDNLICPERYPDRDQHGRKYYCYKKDRSRADGKPLACTYGEKYPESEWGTVNEGGGSAYVEKCNEDEYNLRCNSLKGDGDCVKPGKVKFMEENCKKSCDMCPKDKKIIVKSEKKCTSPHNCCSIENKCGISEKHCTGEKNKDLNNFKCGDITAENYYDCLQNFPLKESTNHIKHKNIITGVSYKDSTDNCPGNCVYYDLPKDELKQYSSKRNKDSVDVKKTKFGPYKMGYYPTIIGDTSCDKSISGNSIEDCINNIPWEKDKFKNETIHHVSHRTINHKGERGKCSNTCIYYGSKPGKMVYDSTSLEKPKHLTMELKPPRQNPNMDDPVTGEEKFVGSHIIENFTDSPISGYFDLCIIKEDKKKYYLYYDNIKDAIQYKSNKPTNTEGHWFMEIGSKYLSWKDSTNKKTNTYNKVKYNLMEVKTKNDEHFKHGDSMAYYIKIDDSLDKSNKNSYKCLVTNNNENSLFETKNWMGKNIKLCGLQRNDKKDKDKVYETVFKDGMPDFTGIFLIEPIENCYIGEINQMEVLGENNFFNLYVYPSEKLTGIKDVGYRGYQNKTISNKLCQNWSDQKPHSHDINNKTFPDKGLGEHNYCRNPDGENTIWCYTTDKKKRLENCKPLNESKTLYLVCDDSNNLLLIDTEPKGNTDYDGVWDTFNDGNENLLRWNKNNSKKNSTVFNMGSETNKKLSLIKVKNHIDSSHVNDNENKGYAIVSSDTMDFCNNYKCLKPDSKTNELKLEHENNIRYCGVNDKVLVKGFGSSAGIFMAQMGQEYKTPTKPTFGTITQPFRGDYLLENFQGTPTTPRTLKHYSDDTSYKTLINDPTNIDNKKLFWDGFIYSHYKDNTTDAINNYETKKNLKELLITQNKVLQDRKDEATKLTHSNSTTKRKIEINTNHKKFKNYRSTRLKYVFIVIAILTVFPILAKFKLLPKNIVMIILVVVLLLIAIYLFFAFYIQERNKDDNYFNERNFIKPTDHEIARSKTKLNLSNKDKERCESLAELGEDLDPANFIIPESVMDRYTSPTTQINKCS